MRRSGRWERQVLFISSNSFRRGAAPAAYLAKRQAQRLFLPAGDVRCGAACLLVVLVVVHRGDGVEHLLVVIVHAQRVAALGQDDQKAWNVVDRDGRDARGRDRPQRQVHQERLERLKPMEGDTRTRRTSPQARPPPPRDRWCLSENEECLAAGKAGESLDRGRRAKLMGHKRRVAWTELLTGVGNEVEAGELVPLLLEVSLQALLALL